MFKNNRRKYLVSLANLVASSMITSRWNFTCDWHSNHYDYSTSEENYSYSQCHQISTADFMGWQVEVAESAAKENPTHGHQQQVLGLQNTVRALGT